MLYNILAIGDVVGGCGVSCLEHHLRAVKKLKNIHFTVVNGENAAMVGLTPNDAERIFSAGADVITLGNHTFGKKQITDYLDDCPYILRPHNLGARVPGRGYGVFDCGRARIAVMNLIGRCDLAFHADNPFKTADELLKSGEKPTFTLLDFHAEATSEKLAMAYYLDGRVSAIWGTHTHVPTADEEVFPRDGLPHGPRHDGGGAQRARYQARAVGRDVSRRSPGPLPRAGEERRQDAGSDFYTG